jgi:alpha-galactosidase
VPASILPLIARHVYNQENALTAALNCDRKLGLSTFLNDPQLSMVRPEDGKKLFDDMLEAQRAYLPEKWFE